MSDQERKDLVVEIRKEIAAEERAKKAEWRDKNRDKIREYNRRYALKRRGKSPVDDLHAKEIAAKIPGFVLLTHRNHMQLQGLLSGGYSVIVTGIDSPDETAFVTLSKGDAVIDTVRNIPHDRLVEAVEWMKVRSKWK